MIESEALDLLRKIDKPISFLCVCGKYRTGKSYLLDKVLLGSSTGFTVGPTINPCTKGLWLWKRPYKCIVDDEEVVVFVVDTEGLGAIDQDENHDTKMVLLGLLLSSLMLYNSMGSIDEGALNSLSLVVNISKSLQSKCNNGKVDDEEFAKNFPAFLWILRDFALQLKDPQGNPISPKQYLENALALQKGSSEAIENKNKIRRLLKYFFADRDCATLVRPTENESDLQNLINLPDEKLRKEFVDQLTALKLRIRKKLRAKVVNGKKVNGPMLADLCVAYTAAINGGQVPSIDSAWSYVCKAQCETALNEVQARFSVLVSEKLSKKLPVSTLAIKEQFAGINAECMGLFKARLVSEIAPEDELTLRTLLQKLKKAAKTTIKRQSAELISEHFDKALSQVVDKVKQNFYPSYAKCKEDIVATINAVPAELKDAPGYAEAKAEVLFGRVMPSLELLNEQIAATREGEVRLLSQKLKSAEADNLSRKTDALKDRETFSQRLQQAEEDKMRLKTQNVLLDERNKAMTAELGRQEEKLQKELSEYKARCHDLDQQLRQGQSGYDKEVQALRDEYMKKDLEANKTIALQAQQLKFMQEKAATCSDSLANKENEVTTLAERLQNSESNLRIAQEDLKAKEKKLAQFKSGGCKTSRQREAGGDLEIENAVLKKQLEITQQQVNENKTAYAELMEAIHSIILPSCYILRRHVRHHAERNHVGPH